MTKPCPAPRPTVEPPAFRVPPGACDCHFHIIGAHETYPMVPERTFTPPEAGQAAYLATHGVLGLERMVVVQPSVYGMDNSCTVAAVRAFGLHRSRGVCMVSADVTPKALRALDAAGIRGVRFITVARGGAPVEQLRTVASKIASLGWHIQMYLENRLWHELLPLITALPVPVVMDHMGDVKAAQRDNDPGYQAVLRLLDGGRGWIKLCAYRVSVAGHPYADVTPLARKLIAHAPERCVWGTDWPHFQMFDHMPDAGELLNLLPLWTDDDAARRRILVDNPAALYGFGRNVK